MNEKILKALGELGEQVQAKLKEANIEVAVFNDGTVVSADKHEQLKSDYKALEVQQTTANTQIEELKKATGTSEELKTELNKLTAEHEQFKADASKRETNFKNLSDIKSKMNGKIAPDMIELLSGKIDLESIVRNEAGDIVDIESKISTIVESYPSAKISTEFNGNEPKDKKTVETTDYSKMSDTEYYAAKQAEQKGS